MTTDPSLRQAGWTGLLVAVIGQRHIDWMIRAACGDLRQGGDQFFPEKIGGGSTDQAKQRCRPCPVRRECLTWAVENDERNGVWGGLSPEERAWLRRCGWRRGDPLPRIRLSRTRGPALDWDREQATKAFKYARAHGTGQAAWYLGVSTGALQRVWDRYELGRPHRNGSRNKRVPFSRQWAQRTHREAQQTSIIKVARRRHVSPRTLHATWTQHGLGTPTAKTA